MDQDPVVDAEGTLAAQEDHPAAGPAVESAAVKQVTITSTEVAPGSPSEAVGLSTDVNENLVVAAATQQESSLADAGRQASLMSLESNESATSSVLGFKRKLESVEDEEEEVIADGNAPVSIMMSAAAAAMLPQQEEEVDPREDFPGGNPKKRKAADDDDLEQEVSRVDEMDSVVVAPAGLVKVESSTDDLMGLGIVPGDLATSDETKPLGPGQIKVVNDRLLLHFPDGVEDRSLGYVVYTGARMRDIASNNPSDMALFLLPTFNSSHLYATLEVRIPFEFLSYHKNVAVRSNAIWGTDVYTDDSDIVAVLIHSGTYRPVDMPDLPPSPPFEITSDTILPEPTTKPEENAPFNADGPQRAVPENEKTVEMDKSLVESGSEAVTLEAAREGEKLDKEIGKEENAMAVDEFRKEANRESQVQIATPKVTEGTTKPTVNEFEAVSKPNETGNHPAVKLRPLPQPQAQPLIATAVEESSVALANASGSNTEANVSTAPSNTPTITKMDLRVTLRILPKLKRYTGTRRNGITSRGWGASHVGESIRVEKVELCSLRSGGASSGIPALADGNLAGAVGGGRKAGAKGWVEAVSQGSVDVRQRKLAQQFDTANMVEDDEDEADRLDTLKMRDALRQKWAGAPSHSAFGDHNSSDEESTAKPPPLQSFTLSPLPSHRKAKKQPAQPTSTLKEISVTLSFSQFSGKAGFQYTPEQLIEWPRELQDFLIRGKQGLATDPDERFLNVSATELQAMEKWAYWRIRIKVDTLCVESQDGVIYKIMAIPGPEENFAVSKNGNCIHSGLRLADVKWRPQGLLLQNDLIPVQRFFWQNDV